MDNRDDWWPRSRPTSLERVLAGGFLIAFCPLVLSAYNHWHLLGFYDRPAAAIIAFAFFLLVLRPHLTRPPSPKQQALYAERSIRVFLDDLGDPWDWDDFTSCSLSDPTVDSIRQRAAGVSLPLSDDEKRALAALADEAEDIASAEGPLPHQKRSS